MIWPVIPATPPLTAPQNCSTLYISQRVIWVHRPLLELPVRLPSVLLRQQPTPSICPSTATTTAAITDATTITTNASTVEQSKDKFIDRSSSTAASSWQLGNTLKNVVGNPLKVVKLLRTANKQNSYF